MDGHENFYATDLPFACSLERNISQVWYVRKNTVIYLLYTCMAKGDIPA